MNGYLGKLCSALFNAAARALTPGLLKILVILAVFILFFSTWPSSYRRHLDDYTISNIYAWRGARPVPPELLIVARDDPSYNFYKIPPRLPFPRLKLAQALQKVKNLGLKYALIDFTLEPEDSPEADHLIEEALQEFPTVLARARLSQERDGGITFVPIDPKFEKAAGMALPFLILKREGYANYISAEKDPQLPLDQRLPFLRPLREYADLKLPVEPKISDIIDFYGPPGTIPAISLHEVVEKDPRQLAELMAGKIVFFGAMNEKETDDKFPVLVSHKMMWGVEIIATITGNLLDNSFIRYPSASAASRGLAVALCVVVFGFLSISTKKSFWVLLMLHLGWFLLCFGVWLAAVYLAFTRYHYYLPGFGWALVFGVLVVFVTLVVEFYKERRFRVRMDRSFGG